LCLYREPLDLVELSLEANPDALVAHNDSQGWTPIHLIILYGGNEEIALMLIRRGGALVALLQSPDIGSPLHLAC
jgi:ankyrin repeat protein